MYLKIADMRNHSTEAIGFILNSFNKITLGELSSKAPLLKRIDRKYVFHIELLPYVLDWSRDEYDILNINGRGIFQYKTHYFDTSELQAYFHHHNGKSNRFKVRKRIYTDYNACFLEIKLKNNKGSTIKHRLPVDISDSLVMGKCRKFLSEYINVDAAMLQPVITVDYSRITLLSKNGIEKITIDLNPEFYNSSNKMQFKNIVIAEVKSEKSHKSFFADLMMKKKIKKGSISKYCLGMISLNESLKQNNFKIPLKNIQKVNNYGL